MKFDAALRQQGLLKIILRHLPAVTPVCEIVVQAGFFLLVHDQLQPEGFGQQLLGEIVAGGAQAAGGDDHVRPAPGDFDARRHPRRVIAHDGVVEHVDAQLRQQDRHIPGVGIGGLAQQKLCADADYFSGIGRFHVCASPCFI